jgi:hypothetical protein
LRLVSLLVLLGILLRVLLLLRVWLYMHSRLPALLVWLHDPCSVNRLPAPHTYSGVEWISALAVGA